MSRLLVALDLASSEEAVSMAEQLTPHVDGFKVGLELLWSAGPTVIPLITDLGAPVFVDAKLHDIPNTVLQAARGLGRLGARWVTVHAAGGARMMEAAVQGLNEGAADQAGVLAVTVLTSLDEGDFSQVGLTGTMKDQVGLLSSLAASAGAEGIVASARECATIRATAPEMHLFTPGIRPAGSPDEDQVRTTTPAEATRAGADYLIVGRAITRADDPVAAAVSVAVEMGRVRAD